MGMNYMSQENDHQITTL